MKAVRIWLVAAMVLMLVAVAVAGCGAKKEQVPPPESEAPQVIDFDQVDEVFPAGELNSVVDADVKPALEEIFQGAKLITIFGMDEGQQDNPMQAMMGSGRHLIYFLKRPIATADVAALQEKLETQGIELEADLAGAMQKLRYQKDIDGVSYRMVIGFRIGEQQIGVGVYPVE